MLFGFCLGGGAAGAVDESRIPLNRAIDIALENSPDLARAKLEVERRGLESANAFAQFLPSLDVETSYGVRAQSPRIGMLYGSSDFNLRLTESLYDNGVGLTKWRSAGTEREIADLAYRNQRDRLILSVSTEFFKYSLSATLVDVRQQQFTIIEKQYRTITSQFEQGVRTRKDYLKFKSELRRAEIQLLGARTAVEASRVELIRLLGFENHGAHANDQFLALEVTPGEVGAVPSVAPDLGTHYRYRIADLRRRVLDNDVYLAKRRHLPQLFANAGAAYRAGDLTQIGGAVTDGGDFTDWSALLTLKYNLWDWGTRRRDVGLATVQRGQTTNALRDELNAFSAENAKLMLDLGLSAKTYRLSRELLDLEGKSYAFLQTEYQNGKVSYLDLIVGLRDLLGAKIEYYTSYFDLRGHLARYRYFEGKIYDAVPVP